MSEENVVLGGRYSLGRILGHGGMAEVYLAQDRRLHRTVAVKVLRSDLARDDNFQERFRREAQSAAALNHPSIVAVYDTGEEHIVNATGAEMTIPYIVMEYVHGTTLREHIIPGDPMPAQRAGEIMAALLSALEYSHRSGIVHRDIKPGNVMINDAGQVKVMDFGIARAVADAASAMTATQAVMGTAQYLSPEQARGQLVDARSDIYSAACVMYELLTGRPPFVGDTPVSIAYQHVREEPVVPSVYNPAVTPALDAVILTGLAKDREARYPSAVAFSRDIALAVAGREPKLVDGAVPLGSDAEATTVLGAAGDTTEALPVMTAATQAIGATTQAMPGGTSPSSAAGGISPRSPHEAAAEEEPEHRKPVWLFVLVALAALGVVAALLWWLDPLGWRGPDTADVPAVVGLTQEDADAALEEVGLVGSYEQVESSDVEKGLVIETDPVAGTELIVGRTVTVTVSAGPTPVTVPKIVGMSKDDAEAELAKVDLTLEVTAEEDKANTEADIITKSSPNAEETASPGDTVSVTVATGEYTVPNVQGQQVDAATKTLEDLGFVVDTTTSATSDQEPGTVISQDKSANSKLEIGSTITLSVAEQATVTVPNVTGRSREDAEGTLQDQGFGTNAQSEASDTVEEGFVIRTDPEANAKVDPGTTVTIYVSSGPATPTEDPTTAPTDTATPTTEEPSATETTSGESGDGPGGDDSGDDDSGQGTGIGTGDDDQD
ncbi:Stk1 family PASTA domain-containing Ser/Thr kinase [Brachybacterium sp. DNPG3]